MVELFRRKTQQHIIHSLLIADIVSRTSPAKATLISPWSLTKDTLFFCGD
jgi:hypothetical protein